MKARPETLEQLIWELRRAFRDLTTAADRELQVLGIQTGDRAFLEFLARETQSVSLSDLARKYALSRQHMHQSLRRLPHPEWIEEIPDAADRRIVRLRLSRKGRAFWEKVRALDQSYLKRLAERLSQERVAGAADLLAQLRRELSPEKEIADGKD
jgi:DNA-binding MarR family transcriptional regulator